MKKPVTTLYRASGWSNANGKASERQPHLFYRAKDVDDLFDKLEQERRFALRRAAALEAFYLSEIGIDEPGLIDNRIVKG